MIAIQALALDTFDNIGHKEKEFGAEHVVAVWETKGMLTAVMQLYPRTQSQIDELHMLKAHLMQTNEDTDGHTTDLTEIIFTQTQRSILTSLTRDILRTISHMEQTPNRSDLFRKNCETRKYQALSIQKQLENPSLSRQDIQCLHGTAASILHNLPTAAPKRYKPEVRLR